MEQPQRDDGFYILSSLRIFKGGQRNSFFFLLLIDRKSMNIRTNDIPLRS